MWEQEQKERNKDRASHPQGPHPLLQVVWCGKVTAPPHHSRKAHKPRCAVVFVSMLKIREGFQETTIAQRQHSRHSGFLYCYIMQSLRIGRYDYHERFIFQQGGKVQTFQRHVMRNESRVAGGGQIIRYLVIWRVHRVQWTLKKLDRKAQILMPLFLQTENHSSPGTVKLAPGSIW